MKWLLNLWFQYQLEKLKAMHTEARKDRDAAHARSVQLFQAAINMKKASAHREADRLHRLALFKYGQYKYCAREVRRMERAIAQLLKDMQ